MSTENGQHIFNTSNKLKNYTIEIGGINIVKEMIISLEMTHQNNSPVVLGRLVINDLVDLNSQLIWRDTSVKVYYMDMFDKIFRKEFYITSIVETLNEKNRKSFIIDLQDKFSYILEHSYISKSFSTDHKTALLQYMGRLSIDSMLNVDYVSTGTLESMNFVVPKHMNNLNYFMGEFYKQGFTWYQTKDSIKLKHYTDLLPVNLPLNSEEKPYKNETDNQLYMNKIIGLNTVFNKRDGILPITKSFGYNIQTKQIDSSEFNDNTMWVNNSDTVNMQTTSGGQYEGVFERPQQHLDFDHHKIIMRDSFFTHNELEMAINGYVRNDLNQIYELFLKGNMGSIDSQHRGNTIINGKYVSNKITDKLIGDTLIQKVMLSRVDLRKNTEKDYKYATKQS